MRTREIWSTLKETLQDWSDDGAARLAAALAYYSLLSLAPLVVIIVSVVGFFVGPEAARGRVAGQLGGVVGAEAAQGIQTVAAHAQSPSAGVVSTIVGIVTLFFGASGVFGELQASLDTVWEVEPKKGRGLWGEMKARFVSFTMVLGVAFLLLVSLIVSSLLSAVGKFLSGALPGGETLWQVVNFAISFGVVTVLFALIFKVVPDARVQWRDVWGGAAFTAALFTLGKHLLVLYLGKAAVGSSYGAAGSIVALVVWVYYAAQILLIGAEFTQVQARHRGRQITPTEDAEPRGASAPEPAASAQRARVPSGA